MKINSIGINAYQQIARTTRTGQPANAQAQSELNLKVQPQNASNPSRVSLRPRTVDGASAMTSNERQALENLLKVINEKGLAEYGNPISSRQSDNPEMIGKLVDVKV